MSQSFDGTTLCSNSLLEPITTLERRGRKEGKSQDVAEKVWHELTSLGISGRRGRKYMWKQLGAGKERCRGIKIEEG